MKCLDSLPIYSTAQDIDDGLNALPTSDGRVLVVDASTDYIEFIDRHYTGRVIFVTDPSVRLCGNEYPPDRQSEILVDMNDHRFVLEEIRSHLERYNLRATGVACFDCESLHLSSLLAAGLGLPYPSPEAVLTSRSKFLSKIRWQQARLDCPACCQIYFADEAITFMQQYGGKIMLKPLTGSGSELSFLCTSVQETEAAFAVMTHSLAAMPKTERMYNSYDVAGALIDPRRVYIAEEYCEGDEYSCDFLIEADRIEIIRVARKWLKPDPAPGTIMAYMVPETPTLDPVRLREKLLSAAQVLGIDRGLCMADFLIAGDRLILLELTPRPGGDCLPPLLRAGCGLDIFGLALDVAEGIPVQMAKFRPQLPMVGLRLFAPLPGGIISRIDTEGLRDDPRLLELKLTCKPGYRVVHPPEAYHSRILGYALFRPFAENTVEQECLELLDKLKVSYNEGAVV
jgi:hypothetical protein